MIKDPNFIIKTVAHFYGLTSDDIKGRSRTSHVFEARNLSVKIMRDILNMSYPSIGKYVGGRHYTTLIQNLNKSKSNIQFNALFARFKVALNKADLEDKKITLSLEA